MTLKAKFTNHCPPMPVKATWRPRLRRTTELATTGAIILQPTPFATITVKFDLTFPITDVRFVSPGIWRVDAGVARGRTEGGGIITVVFEPEGVHRASPEECDKYDGDNLMIAEEFHAQVRAVLKDGRVFVGDATYPEVAADPGAIFGLFKYTVREVDAFGELESTESVTSLK